MLVILPCTYQLAVMCLLNYLLSYLTAASFTSEVSKQVFIDAMREDELRVFETFINT